MNFAEIKNTPLKFEIMVEAATMMKAAEMILREMPNAWHISNRGFGDLRIWANRFYDLIECD